MNPIDLSDSFDNIYGRVRDINASDLDDTTKEALITAAQNKLKEIYISRMNKETDRGKIRELSKEIFNASKNRKNNDLGVEILTAEMLDDLFDNPTRLDKMAQKAYVPNLAVQKIADTITK